MENKAGNLPGSGQMGRREVLISGAALAAAAAAPSMAAAARGSAACAAPTVPAGISEPLLVHARLRVDLCTGRGLHWYGGWLWGKRPFDRAQRLFAVEGVSFTAIGWDPDGAMRMTMDEAGFWLDPRTREVLDEWINPLNGLACPIKHFRTKQRQKFLASGEWVATRPEIDGEGRIEPPSVAGPYTWSGETLVAAMPNRRDVAERDPLSYTGAVRAHTSLATFGGATAELARPLDRWVDCFTHFQSMGPWYPWMRMGQEAGQLSFQNEGRKLRSVDELPARLRQLLDSRQPGFLGNPSI